MESKVMTLAELNSDPGTYTREGVTDAVKYAVGSMGIAGARFHSGKKVHLIRYSEIIALSPDYTGRGKIGQRYSYSAVCNSNGQTGTPRDLWDTDQINCKNCLAALEGFEERRAARARHMKLDGHTWRVLPTPETEIVPTPETEIVPAPEPAPAPSLEVRSAEPMICPHGIDFADPDAFCEPCARYHEDMLAADPDRYWAMEDDPEPTPAPAPEPQAPELAPLPKVDHGPYNPPKYTVTELAELAIHAPWSDTPVTGVQFYCEHHSPVSALWDDIARVTIWPRWYSAPDCTSHSRQGYQEGRPCIHVKAVMAHVAALGRDFNNLEGARPSEPPPPLSPEPTPEPPPSSRINTTGSARACDHGIEFSEPCPECEATPEPPPSAPSPEPKPRATKKGNATMKTKTGINLHRATFEIMYKSPSGGVTALPVKGAVYWLQTPEKTHVFAIAPSAGTLYLVYMPDTVGVPSHVNLSKAALENRIVATVAGGTMSPMRAAIAGLDLRTWVDGYAYRATHHAKVNPSECKACDGSGYGAQGAKCGYCDADVPPSAPTPAPAPIELPKLPEPKPEPGDRFVRLCPKCGQDWLDKQGVCHSCQEQTGLAEPGFGPKPEPSIPIVDVPEPKPEPTTYELATPESEPGEIMGRFGAWAIKRGQDRTAYAMGKTYSLSTYIVFNWATKQEVSVAESLSEATRIARLLDNEGEYALLPAGPSNVYENGSIEALAPASEPTPEPEPQPAPALGDTFAGRLDTLEQAFNELAAKLTSEMSKLIDRLNENFNNPELVATVRAIEAALAARAPQAPSEPEPEDSEPVYELCPNEECENGLVALGQKCPICNGSGLAQVGASAPERTQAPSEPTAPATEPVAPPEPASEPEPAAWVLNPEINLDLHVGLFGRFVCYRCGKALNDHFECPEHSDDLVRFYRDLDAKLRLGRKLDANDLNMLISISDEWVTWAVYSLGSQQDPDELAAGVTLRRNDVGYSGADSAFGSSLYAGLGKYGSLTIKQIERARAMLKKYTRSQLTALANKDRPQPRPAWIKVGAQAIITGETALAVEKGETAPIYQITSLSYRRASLKDLTPGSAFTTTRAHWDLQPVPEQASEPGNDGLEDLAL